MFKSKKVLSFIMALGLLLLAGCGNSGEVKTSGDGESGSDSGKYKIGVTVYYMSEFITLAVGGLEDAAEKHNVDINVLEAKNDVATQISQMENLIAQGVDAIIVAAVDSDSLDGTIKKARDAGIEVVGLNMIINSDHLSSYIGPNDVQAGELETQYVVDQLGGKGNVVIFEGPIGISAQIQRKEGIYNVIDANDGMNVLEIQTANWSREEALTIMENWIQSHGDKIDAVVAQNDEMALGATQALENAGMRDDVLVVGVDAIEDAVKAIEAGRMDASVFQDAALEGGQAVDLAVALLKGEEVEKYNAIEMELVTKENAAEYLKIYQ
ncbi:substrate-binding domain-containing protein [Bacillus sp. FJAT-50079]|uniref:substrate-binding domain-containing protein n=1 Tax=Bacillus sp. FJAT-50079 TaxID=2833577 RepID=UPI001BCA4CC0|nr:substrate-binding domain-containing protein [Bacillus sp. FJAT-50079]MBS4208132.1 substrate-binding domain-containing protein [Bacillus sp. FJAT-50079]